MSINPTEPIDDAAAPADPIIDDLDAWLDGLSVPEATLDICGSARLGATHDALVEDLRAQRKIDEAIPEGDRDAAWGERAADLTARIDANAAEMKRASRRFRLRALTADENDALLEEHTTIDPKTRQPKVDAPALVIAQVATALIEPDMTPAQVDKLRKRLSAGEWRRIMDTVRDLTQGIVDLPL